MNEQNRSTSETKSYESGNGPLGKVIGYAQDTVETLSAYRMVVRRPNAKLVDIPVKVPALFVAIGFLVFLWLAPVLLAIGLAATLYFQFQVSFESTANQRNRDVEDVEYRQVD